MLQHSKQNETVKKRREDNKKKTAYIFVVYPFKSSAKCHWADNMLKCLKRSIRASYYMRDHQSKKIKLEHVGHVPNQSIYIKFICRINHQNAYYRIDPI